MALNSGDGRTDCSCRTGRRGCRLLLSTVDDATLVEGGAMLLRSNEGVVLRAG